MIRPLIRAGYDFSYGYLFKLDGVAEDVSDAVISIALKNADKTAELITDTLQTDTGAADWSNGEVLLRFSNDATTGLTAGHGFIELSVTMAGEKIPYRDIAVDIEAGFIA